MGVEHLNENTGELTLRDVAAGLEEGIGFFCRRSLGDGANQVVQEILSALRAMAEEPGCTPARLLAEARKLTKAKIAEGRQRRIAEGDGGRAAEADAKARLRAELVGEILRCLPEWQRKVLGSFYLENKTVEEICQEQNVTESQVRLCRSCARELYWYLSRPMGLQRVAKASHRAIGT